MAFDPSALIPGFDYPTSAPAYQAPIAQQVGQFALPILSGIAGGFPVPSSSSGSTSGNSNSTLTGGVTGNNSTTGNTNTQGNATATGSQQGTSFNSSNSTGGNNLQSLLQSLSQLTSNQATTNNFGTQGNALLSQILPSLGNLLQGANLQPYLANQIQGINNNSNLQSQAVQQILAARGLANSPVAAAIQARNEGNRIAQITGLQQQIPLLQQQQRQQGLNTASGILGLLPRETVTSGTQAQTGSQTGNQTGTNYSGTTGYGNTSSNYGQQSETGQNTNVNQSQQSTTQQQQNQNTNTNQNTQQQQQQGGGIGGILGGIGSALASLFLPIPKAR